MKTMRTVMKRWRMVVLFLGGVGVLSAETRTVGPLSLQEAIQRALEHNRQIKVVRFSPEIARARLLGGKGAFDPALTVGRNYASEQTPFAVAAAATKSLIKSDGYRAAVEGRTQWGLDYSIGTSWTAERVRGAVGDYTAYSGISVTQPLLKGAGADAQLYEVRLLKADVKISEWEFRQIAIDTVTRVIVAYSDLQFAHEYLRVTQRSRDLAAGLIRENEIRVNAGGMSNNQLVQARARAAARGEAVILADRALRDADLRLRHMLGEEIRAESAPLLVVQAAEVSPGRSWADGLESAWARRPDFQQARLLLGKREADVAFTRNWLMPRLDVVGGYGFSGVGETSRGSRRMVNDGDFSSYSAGVVLTVPLTFARERGRLRAARLEREQTEEDLARLKQEIALNVSLAAGRLDSVHQRINATRFAYDLAKAALDDEEKKLRTGTSTTFVVLSLQESLSGVEVAMYRAIAEERIAAALYDREIGCTLERHGLSLSMR
jgi:outer membrane protein